MSYAMSPPVALAEPTARAAFIKQTYAHLAGAILVFAGLEGVLVNTLLNNEAARNLLRQTFMMPYSWVVLMIAFMGVSWLANSWAHSEVSRGVQYAGLGLYILAEAVIFLPILYIAAEYYPGDVIPKAGAMTLAIFGGLTMAVLMTGHDFSFLRTALVIGGCLATGLVLVGAIMGFSLGLWFSFAMVAFACGCILYDTSNIMHHYRTDQYVAASLALFASVALLFWYILRIVMEANRR
jgi:FtsH-binding integral membrane protein